MKRFLILCGLAACAAAGAANWELLSAGSREVGGAKRS